MAATIYDVAKKAGVGIGTVSRAINNSPHINVGTKARILAIANELHYQPHALAQSLARKKTNTIASVVPFFTNYFYVELLKSVQRALSRSHYDLILFSVDRMNRRDRTIDRVLSERRCDGVLIISLGVMDGYAEKFIAAGLPVSSSTICTRPSIRRNREPGGAFAAASHLHRSGHRRIGIDQRPPFQLPAKLRSRASAWPSRCTGWISTTAIWSSVTPRPASHGFNEAAGYAADAAS